MVVHVHPLSAGQAQLHAARLLPTRHAPHAADEHFWVASWTWRTMGFDLLTDAWVSWGQSCLLSHTKKSNLPGCESRARSSHTCLNSQSVRGVTQPCPPLWMDCSRRWSFKWSWPDLQWKFAIFPSFSAKETMSWGLTVAQWWTMLSGTRSWAQVPVPKKGKRFWGWMVSGTTWLRSNIPPAQTSTLTQTPGHGRHAERTVCTRVGRGSRHLLQLWQLGNTASRKHLLMITVSAGAACQATAAAQEGLLFVNFSSSHGTEGHVCLCHYPRTQPGGCWA